MLAEIAVSFVVSPFSASRRALVVLIALTIAAGWLAVRAARGAHQPMRTRSAWLWVTPGPTPAGSDTIACW